MIRRIRLLSFMLICTLLLSSFGLVFAQEPPVEPPVIPIDPPMPPIEFAPDLVYIESHRVAVEINNQVATTRVEQVFVNESDRMAEGTYIFPLPRGAVVSDLVMYVDGEAISARILGAEEARNTYEEIVRRLRDPALLEYIGQDAIQASVFPIQPHDEIKIEIEYSHILPVENGLVHYVYPLRTDQFTRRPVRTLSVSVTASSNDPISTVYSPSHPVIVTRDDDHSFKVGYEASNVREPSSFSLYYGLASETIDLNLLTYRESAAEDGFFLLLLAPPVQAEEVEVLPKDVIIVLDQSGSMDGEKWEQARDAAKFVLDNLNEADRFNVIAFSTGWRIFANDLEGIGQAADAKQWIDTLEAIGGTDINGALTEALNAAEESERQTVILFLTDGLPTEGETDISSIIENAQANAPQNTRLFSFGVGNDVDTFLLDQLAALFNGAGSYVRPNERIDEEVAALYNKIASPVMTDISLDFGGDVVVEDSYPASPLPDLFLGEQLIIAGRYRGDGESSITLNGKVNGQNVSFIYEGIDFPANAGGEVSIPRLWATRKIGAMLNTIRLNGENEELVDSIVRLSLRYGIITPYTSFMIDETDIFSQSGRDEANQQAAENLGRLDDDSSGEAAVSAADAAFEMEEAQSAPAQAPMPTSTSGGTPPAEGMPGGGFQPQQPVQVVGDRTFVLRGETWIDTTYDSDAMTPQQVVFLSDAYFALLDEYPEVGSYLALGDHLIVVIEGQAYEIVPE